MGKDSEAWGMGRMKQWSMERERDFLVGLVCLVLFEHMRESLRISSVIFEASLAPKTLGICSNDLKFCW
jgi:hypothetical protein